MPRQDTGRAVGVNLPQKPFVPPKIRSTPTYAGVTFIASHAKDSGNIDDSDCANAATGGSIAPESVSDYNSIEDLGT